MYQPGSWLVFLSGHRPLFWPSGGTATRLLYSTAPRNRRRNRNGPRGGSNRKSSPKHLVIEGPFGIGLQLPIAKLPIKIGSDESLKASQSIYPTIHGLSVPIPLQQFSTITGTLSGVLHINPNSLITSFPTRLGAVFDEYCITGALLEIRVVHRAGPAQGLVYVYMDEKDFGAPTASEANCVPRLEALIHNAAMPVLHHISWKASDVADLEWRSVS